MQLLVVVAIGNCLHCFSFVDSLGEEEKIVAQLRNNGSQLEVRELLHELEPTFVEFAGLVALEVASFDSAQVAEHMAADMVPRRKERKGKKLLNVVCIGGSFWKKSSNVGMIIKKR